MVSPLVVGFDGLVSWEEKVLFLMNSDGVTVDCWAHLSGRMRM